MAKERENPNELIKCQFCAEETSRALWTDAESGQKDVCPCCGMKYDPILAQEGDD